MSKYLCFVIKEKINDKPLPESFVLTRSDSNCRDREINIFGKCSHTNKMTNESCIEPFKYTESGVDECRCSRCGEIFLYEDTVPVAYKTIYGALMATKLGVGPDTPEKRFGVYKAFVNISDTLLTSHVIDARDAWWLGAIDILANVEFNLYYEAVCKFERYLSDDGQFKVLSFTDVADTNKHHPFYGDTICEGSSHAFTFIKEDKM